jgi:hypothetical protein
MRIAMIHALFLSIAPSQAAFARHWPEARVSSLLDDSLAADLARDGALTPDMTDRFLTLARYAKRTGADGILFTCSAFGPCIEACAAALAPMPVLKPNEAMIEAALRAAGPGGRIGLVATFAPTLRTMPAEFPPGTMLDSALAEGAMAALDRGDGVALTQFSLARAAGAVASATGKRVITTPDSAVLKLKSLLS